MWSRRSPCGSCRTGAALCSRAFPCLLRRALPKTKKSSCTRHPTSMFAPTALPAPNGCYNSHVSLCATWVRTDVLIPLGTHRKRSQVQKTALSSPVSHPTTMPPATIVSSGPGRDTAPLAMTIKPAPGTARLAIGADFFGSQRKTPTMCACARLAGIIAGVGWGVSSRRAGRQRLRLLAHWGARQMRWSERRTQRCGGGSCGMAMAAGPLQVSCVSLSNGFERWPAFLCFLFSQVPALLLMSAVARPRPFPCEVKRLCTYMGLTLVRSHMTRLNARGAPE